MAYAYMLYYWEFSDLTQERKHIFTNYEVMVRANQVDRQ